MLQAFKGRLIQRQKLNHDTYLFRFEILNRHNLVFQAGQYLIVFVPHEGGDIKRRLLSIVTTPNDKEHFELLLQLVPGGVVSEYLRNLAIGAEASFQGPAGLFTLHQSQRDKIFIATGTGIAPIKSMILSSVKDQTTNIKLFWGMKHYRDVYFVEELVKLTGEHPYFEFSICISRDENLDEVNAKYKKHFLLGRVTIGLAEKILNFDYYVCGGREIVESLRQHLYDVGVPKEQVFFEKF